MQFNTRCYQQHRERHLFVWLSALHFTIFPATVSPSLSYVCHGGDVDTGVGRSLSQSQTTKHATLGLLFLTAKVACLLSGSYASVLSDVRCDSSSILMRPPCVRSMWSTISVRMLSRCSSCQACWCNVRISLASSMNWPLREESR